MKESTVHCQIILICNQGFVSAKWSNQKRCLLWTLVASLKCSREQRAQAVEPTLTPLPQSHSQTWRCWPRLHGPGSDTHPVSSKEEHKQMSYCQIFYHFKSCISNLARSANGNILLPCLEINLKFKKKRETESESHHVKLTIVCIRNLPFGSPCGFPQPTAPSSIF